MSHDQIVIALGIAVYYAVGRAAIALIEIVFKTTIGPSESVRHFSQKPEYEGLAELIPWLIPLIVAIAWIFTLTVWPVFVPVSVAGRMVRRRRRQ